VPVVPLTFPSHPAAAIPLKLWRPRWFDGVALVVGSTAPDLAYVLDGSGLPVWPFSHQVAGLVGWCLPLTLVLTWLIRRAAPALAVHLPEAGPLALRDYGALGAVRHRWPVTVVSALLGAASHLLLDQLELHVPWTEYVMHVLGAVAFAVLSVRIGRGRLIRRWHGAPPTPPRRPALFWSVAGAVALPLIAVTPLLPGAFLYHTTGARLLCAAGAGLLVASAAVAVASRRPEQVRSRR
jgi:uncharacterized protein DUF4184